MFRQLEAWMAEYTGYPTVSGHDEFLYEPDKPLRGDLSDYAYNQRGAIGYVVELWDLFKRLGMPRPPKFVAVLRARVARRPRQARVVGPRRERRPLVPAVAPVRPPAARPGRDRRHRSAGRDLEPAAPRARRAVQRADPACSSGSPRSRRGSRSPTSGASSCPAASPASRSQIKNDGYLGSYGLPSAKKLDFNEPLYATARSDGCELSIRARRTRSSATSTAGATACTPAPTCPRIRARAAPRTPRGRATSCAAPARWTCGSARAARASSRRASRCEPPHDN